MFATLRARYGNSCLGYIDDSFFTEDTAVSRREAIKNAVRLFMQLGFVPHPTKSVFQPTQILEFLGFYLNSIAMRVTVTETKVANILSICQKFLQRKKFTIREIASLIGTLVSTFPGVELWPLYYRSLERDKDLALKTALGNLRQTCLYPHPALMYLPGGFLPFRQHEELLLILYPMLLLQLMPLNWGVVPYATKSVHKDYGQHRKQLTISIS